MWTSLIFCDEKDWNTPSIYCIFTSTYISIYPYAYIYIYIFPLNCKKISNILHVALLAYEVMWHSHGHCFHDTLVTAIQSSMGLWQNRILQPREKLWENQISCHWVYAGVSYISAAPMPAALGNIRQLGLYAQFSIILSVYHLMDFNNFTNFCFVNNIALWCKRVVDLFSCNKGTGRGECKSIRCNGWKQDTLSVAMGMRGTLTMMLPLFLNLVYLPSMRAICTQYTVYCTGFVHHSSAVICELIHIDLSVTVSNPLMVTVGKSGSK